MNFTRRTFTLAGAAVGVAAALGSLPAHASDASDAQALVDKARVTVTQLANDKDFVTVKSSLANAKAVLVFPQVLKAGFVLGGSGGTGVLLVRDAKTGDWVGPAFYTMGSGSIGFQAGASSAEILMMVNSQKALDSLFSNKLKLGGDASVAAGPKGVGTGASVTADFVVYSRVKGAYAGMSVEGSVLDVRQKLNTGYYGKEATPVDILVKKDVHNPAAAPLQATLKGAAK
ncbi:MAG TPA: lipid-binding SYLF domain-containing protein [Caldimonas sp.]|jgi:lipid-binding SYLF domain-containing protein